VGVQMHIGSKIKTMFSFKANQYATENSSKLLSGLDKCFMARVKSEKWLALSKRLRHRKRLIKI
jgi:hypothetical protein